MNPFDSSCFPALDTVVAVMVPARSIHWARSISGETRGRRRLRSRRRIVRMERSTRRVLCVRIRRLPSTRAAAIRTTRRTLCASSKGIANPTHLMRSQNRLASLGLTLSDWFERWFPDAFALAMAAVVIVFLACLSIGSPVAQTAQWFGAGFWDLVAFTMQMSMIIVTGYA